MTANPQPHAGFKTSHGRTLEVVANDPRPEPEVVWLCEKLYHPPYTLPTKLCGLCAADGDQGVRCWPWRKVGT